MSKHIASKPKSLEDSKPELSELHYRAAEESGLAAEYADDPVLLRFYMRRLLKKGWAGTYTETEQKYVAAVHKAEGKYQGQRDALARRRLPARSAAAPPSTPTPDASSPGQVS